MSSDTVRIPPVPRRSASSATVGSWASANAWRMAALVWTVHIVICQAAATMAYRYGTIRMVRESPERSGQFVPDPGEKSGAYGLVLAPLTGLAHWIVEPFRAWDGTWYRLVSVEGYSPQKAATAAFWPLYPWLMDLGSQITGLTPETIGYLISNIAFFFGLYFLYRLVTLDFDASVAQRTLWAIALFPTAFFFSAIYTESLFLLLAVAALYYARKGEWLAAGAIGFLAALTRSAGVMLLAPFAVLFIQQHGWNPLRWFPKAVAAGLPALGPVVFGIALQRRDLKFFDWMQQQWQWNRFSATPWRTFDCTLNGCTARVRFISGQKGDFDVLPIDWGWISQILRHPTWHELTSSEFRYRFGQSHVLELVVTVLAIAVVGIGLRTVPLYYTAFIVPALVVPLLTPSSVNPLMSMPRFVLPLFPLFVVVALLIRNQRLGVVLGAMSSLLLVALTMQFALWYWVS